jgi:hypothetical protein
VINLTRIKIDIKDILEK